VATATRKKSQQSQTTQRSRPIFLPPTMETVVVIRQICAATQMGRARIEAMIKSGEFPAPDWKPNPADKKRRWTVELFNEWRRTHIKRSGNATE